MESIPQAARPVVEVFAAALTRPTSQRFVLLLWAAILTTGRRTVSNLLRTVGGLAEGHPSSYHRVWSCRRWLGWRLGQALATLMVEAWQPSGVLSLVGDDTVVEHRGKHVYGKACHRDAVRSSHSFTAYRWGHKWVVLAILVRFPFATRPWALPVLVALYRSPEWNQQHQRRHKTPSQLLRQLLVVLLRWFPGRKFLFAGEGGYGTHELARFAHQQRRRLTLVSRFYATANLYAPPPPATGKRVGRPRKKGAQQPAPQQVVAGARRKRLKVAWYGGGQRAVEVVSETAHWYKHGAGLVPVRWVFVHDRGGTHRDEYFFSTDPGLTAQQIIESYTGRWSIETTFQELRSCLKLETTRGWSEPTVLRVAPSLFGLYSIVALLYARLPARPQQAGRLLWPGKQTVTFSDALTAVRRWLWVEWVFSTTGHQQAFAKLPGKFKNQLLYALAPAT